eukprot:gnl/TRDRNA2_/TRDRNA2_183954_c0_seq1.p1 gnl/TRDRNA2_/TRDRNA2_183954_c0~~gnl/TRDRNA2_/TRDRNA2_183954_c0_seq1.p1  ORF type:complete len:536 (+),score=133.69 gnl/TRDRNA2_/TRDRNA2_183954_c0_seq1:74-1681(+)
MYKLDNLLQDVAQKRGRLAKDSDGSSTDYHEAWNAYMKYAKSCMEQRRGLALSSFCKIGWQSEKTRNAKVQYRPFFQLTEQFCRAYAPNEARKIGAPQGEREMCPFEDFNFSKAAIKFSNQLTKDQVFTGIRSIVQALGEYAAEGRQADIEFGDIGRLCCKEQEFRFHFASDIYAREGLEAPEPGGSVLQPSAPAFSRNAPEEAMSLGVRGTGVGEVPDYNAMPEDTIQEFDNGIPAPMPMEDLYGIGGGGYEAGPAPPSRRSLGSCASAPSLTSGARPNPLLTAAQFKREVAYKEAMDRHISEMEEKAMTALKERDEWNSHVAACLEQEKSELSGSRTRAKENRQFIEQQMRFGDKKRKQQRADEVEAASAHGFPVFHQPQEEDLVEFTKGQQARMRKDLDDQVRTNNTLRNLAKQRERQMEVGQLEANRQEMALLRQAERAKKAYDREALSTAWNSEIRLKNIWKAIDSHGQSGTGSQPPQVLYTDSVPPSRGSSTVSAGRMMTGSKRTVPMGAGQMTLEAAQARLKTPSVRG